MKLQIKNRWTGSELFEYEKENNTIKNTVVEAVKRGAYLQDADLRGADLRGADLRGAKAIPYIPLACPSDDAFTGWKKLRDGKVEYLVRLKIPADARRSSANTTKCRCDKAKVVSIEPLNGGPVVHTILHNAYGHTTTSAVGKMVYPDSWDDNRFNECSNGRLFFINKQEAINY